MDVAAAAKVEDVLDALSVGTRDQIATLLRLTIAEQLRSAIILDDHLAHTDPERLAWFRTLLAESASKTQVIVITCRAEDYFGGGEPTNALAHDSGNGFRRTDFERMTKRFVPVRRNV